VLDDAAVMLLLAPVANNREGVVMDGEFPSTTLPVPVTAPQTGDAPTPEPTIGTLTKHCVSRLLTFGMVVAAAQRKPT
jgi:hypothetical protein